MCAFILLPYNGKHWQDKTLVNSAIYCRLFEGENSGEWPTNKVWILNIL